MPIWIRYLTCGQNGIVLATPCDGRLRISTGIALHLHGSALGRHNGLSRVIADDGRTAHLHVDGSPDLVGHGQDDLALVFPRVCLLQVLYLQRVGGRGDVVAEGEARVLEDQRRTVGDEDAVETVAALFDPHHIVVGGVLHGALQFHGASNVFDLLLSDVRN